MDWDSYKAYCESADYFSRWALEKSLESMGCGYETVKRELREILDGTPLEKPQDHLGGSNADFFKIACHPGVAALVIDQLALKTAQGNRDDREMRVLKQLKQAWQEYLGGIQSDNP